MRYTFEEEEPEKQKKLKRKNLKKTNGDIPS